MLNYTIRRIASLFLFLLISSFSFLFAQGVTSSTISGNVVGNDGKALEGATVQVVHLPTGTKYSASTSKDGGFTFSNLRVGGPYTTTISFTGLETKKEENIFLTLGQTYFLNATMGATNAELQTVVVTANKAVKKTGATTTISNATIQRLPTVTRKFEDFSRLTPQSNGLSFAGKNRLFNNVTIDGSIFTNPYGLDRPLPGGQTNSQPISLDAIDQIVVSISPFDVRQAGFTGANVNAVTKSGTNDFKGSVYSFFRTQALIGYKVKESQLVKTDFSGNQTGVSFGGPIIKNKLFYFVGAEIERITQPASQWRASRSGLPADNISVSNVSVTDLDLVANILKTKYNYDPGAYENYDHKTTNDKFNVKFDWNINDKHHLVFSYKYLKSSRDVLPNPAISNTGRGPNSLTLPFENNSYIINNNINSFVAELSSRFNSKYANNFQVSYTSFRDFRDSKSKPFGSIDILNNNRNYISFGLERFSTNNQLDQDVLQITNNFNIYLNKHNLTIGVNYEQFDFRNSFNLFYFPGYTFNSVADFVARTTVGNPNYVDFNADAANSLKAPYKNDFTKFAQASAYVQDEINVSNRLKLNLGLRVDLPIYFTELAAKSYINGQTWYNADGQPTRLELNKFPTARLMLSPRIGFNWNASGDKDIVFRGGTGLFVGRIPFVWLGNQTSNQDFSPFYTFQLNGTSSDFKFPKLWRTNLGSDFKLPWGMVGTVDVLISKDLNAVVHRNYNMKLPSAKLSKVGAGGDDRPYYEFSDSRAYQPGSGFFDAGTIVMENTNEGYAYSVTAQLSKTIGNNFFASLAYTFGESKDITSNPGEIAANAFQTNPTLGNPNKPVLGYSDHDVRHRFIGAITWRKEYGNYATSIGLVYEGVQGGPGENIGDIGGRYSYTYAGDLNNDGAAGNDLMFIPADASQIKLQNPAQWPALDAFIRQDPYLSENRGQYAQRNAAIIPFWHHFDLKVTQDIYFKSAGGKKHTLQVTFDVLNVGNLLNSSWGVRQTAYTRTPLSVVSVDAAKVPTFKFDESAVNTFISDNSLSSRWQAQIGLRYLFNQ